MNEIEELCVVCSDALTEDRALCGGCMHEFHLALRIDRPARDCGETWIDEETQSLAFGCNVCLGRIPPQEPERKAYQRRTGTSAREIARGRRRAGKGG